MKNKIIAIIPARGGSKGIPRKNIRLLAGKPLIAYSIEAALKLKYISKTIVSTEDKEIRDSSAAAIASSGLLDLSGLRGREDFKGVAINILSSLCDNYLCEEEKGGY